MKDIILYHSSKAGLIGNIKPISRPNCDFGQGFYLGTDELQTQSLVLSNKFENPVCYRVLLKISEIDENRILKLNGLDWVFFVLYNRNHLEELKGTTFYEKYAHLADNKDIIIGPIADDNMRNAILDFEEDYITDEVLKKCLSTVDYGLQYVLKTPLSCSKVDILESNFIKKDSNLPALINYAEIHRQQGVEDYKQIKRSAIRTGRYLFEIIEEEKQKTCQQILEPVEKDEYE